MKRVLSLVLALVMVFGTIMPAFAEDAVAIAAASQAATDLVSYGLIAGSDKGLEEDKPLTRQEMAVIYAKMYGKAAEAEAYAFPSSFTDDPANWATPWIAYAEIQGWMVGDGAGATFRPLDYVSVQEINTLMVKALGHEVVWETVNADAAALGVVVEAADETLVLRGEIFATIRGALDLDPKDATETLGTTLALTGYVAPEPPTPAELEVVSVTALNLNQVEVVFNQEVDADSAEKGANYSVEDMTIADVSLLEDGMTVVLTLTDGAAQQAELDVTVEDVETAEELVMADYEIENVQFLDMEIPTALSAEVVGKDTIKITFSEPVKPNHATEADQLKKAGFEVNEGKLYIENVTLQNNNTEALVKLYSDLKAGDVTIEANGTTEDYAKFGVVKKSFEVTVVADEDAPVVVGYEKATPNSVTLIFNEEIAVESGTNTNFYHTNSGNPTLANITSADIDGKKLVLDFSANPLPKGTAYVYVLKESLKDLWDNENAQAMIVVEVEVDTTAPTVDGDIKVNAEDKITIYFSEDLTKSIAEDEANYMILDEDGDEVEDAVKTATYTASTASAAAKVVIDLEDKLGGDYTIVIEDLEDVYDNEIADTTVPFTVDDLTDPDAADFTAKIYKAGIAGQMVKVSFGEAMADEGKYSVLDLEKYTINGHVLATLDVEPTITLVDGGKAVEIAIASDETTDGIDLAATSTIIIARVADAAGNYTATNEFTFTYVEQGNVTIKDVNALDTVTIEVVFSDELVEFDADDLVLTTDKSAVGAAITAKLTITEVETTVNSDGNTVATFTVADADAVEYDLATPVYAYIVTADPVSHNVYGEALVQENNRAADDKIAPAIMVYDHDTNDTTAKVDKITSDQAEVKIFFEEDLDFTTISVLTFEVKDFDVVAVDKDGADASVVVLTLSGSGDKALAANSVTQVYPVKDAAGNIVEDLDSEVAVFTDETAPTATATITNATTVSVVFNEVVDETTAEAAAYVISTADATDTETLTSATLEADGKTVTLVFDDAVIAAGDTVTVPVTVTDVDANAVVAPIVITLP